MLSRRKCFHRHRYSNCWLGQGPSVILGHLAGFVSSDNSPAQHTAMRKQKSKLLFYLLFYEASKDVCFEYCSLKYLQHVRGLAVLCNVSFCHLQTFCS
jgi:hypothetical protein